MTLHHLADGALVEGEHQCRLDVVGHCSELPASCWSPNMFLSKAKTRSEEAEVDGIAKMMRAAFAHVLSFLGLIFAPELEHTLGEVLHTLSALNVRAVE